MVEVVVEKEIPKSADAVWDMIKDFGDISWSGMGDVEVEGSGIGMVRKIIVGPDQAAEERLEAYDDAGKTFTYSIKDGHPMPVTGLRGTPRIEAIDENHCRLVWTATGNAVDGVEEAQAADGLRGFYSGLVEIVAGAAENL